jgi:tyrosine-protein kinase Etk/Wzc
VEDDYANRDESGTLRDGRDDRAGIIGPVLGAMAVFLRHWKVVAGTTVASLVAAAVVTLLLPEQYTSRTVLVQSQAGSESRLQAIASQMSGDLPALTVAGANPNVRLIGSIISSRALADSIARQVDRPAKRIQIVQNQRDGSVAIEITDTDPERAARVANLYPVAINAIVAGLGAQSTATRHEFLNRQLLAAREVLQAAEDRLTEFRVRSNAPDLHQQAGQAIGAAAELQRQISAKEVEISQLRRVATAENPQLRAAAAELEALRSQLQRVTTGRGGTVFPSLQQSPELQIDAARLMREFTEAQQVYTALQMAVAESQISASSTLPVLSVLDLATPPAAPSGPNSRLILMLAAIVGFVLGTALAFSREYMGRLRGTPEGRTLAGAWDGFKADTVGRVSPRHRSSRAPATGSR